MHKLFFIFSLLFISTLATASSLRVEAEQLNDNLNMYTIIDVRDNESYKNGHIHNALNLPASLTYEKAKLNGKLTNPFAMQKVIQDIGLTENDAIVIYDNGAFFDAARVFWALEVYGFKNVKLLNAGFAQWKVKDLTTSTKTPKVIKSDYITIVNNQRLATKFATQIATKNPNQIIIDARPNKAYIGKVSSASRFGHIPKATNIPASHNIKEGDKVSSLKDIDELKEIYKDIPKEKKIVLYCAIGKISATNYFAMRELGYNVSNYDASWKEWGNDLKLPVVNPSNK